MQNNRTDSNLKVIFQTVASVVAGIVGENPALGLHAAAHIFDRATAPKTQG